MNKAKFGAFLLRRYKGVALYLVGIGIIFGVFILFVVLDLMLRPSILDKVSSVTISAVLIVAEVLVVAGSWLRSNSRNRKAKQFVNI